MKIFTFFHNYYKEDKHPEMSPFWTVMPDSTMLRSGKPVFLPDIEHETYRLYPTLCLRIDRLGKRVAPKFAGRYFGGMAPAVMVISGTALKMIDRGLIPYSSELLFDGACLIGDFMECSAEAIIRLRYGISETIWDLSCLKLSPEKALAEVSRCNTIKTGDLLLVGIDSEGVVAHIDTSACASLNYQNLLKFYVK